MRTIFSNAISSLLMCVFVSWVFLGFRYIATTLLYDVMTSSVWPSSTVYLFTWVKLSSSLRNFLLIFKAIISLIYLIFILFCELKHQFCHLVMLRSHCIKAHRLCLRCRINKPHQQHQVRPQSQQQVIVRVVIIIATIFCIRARLVRRCPKRSKSIVNKKHFIFVYLLYSCYYHYYLFYCFIIKIKQTFRRYKDLKFYLICL